MDYTRRRFEQLHSEHPDDILFLKGEYKYWTYDVTAMKVADLLSMEDELLTNAKHQKVLTVSPYEIDLVCRRLQQKGCKCWLDSRPFEG